MEISEKQQKTEKKFLVSEKITFESVALNSPYYEENTCHRLLMCEQTVLRFLI